MPTAELLSNSRREWRDRSALNSAFDRVRVLSLRADDCGILVRRASPDHYRSGMARHFRFEVSLRDIKPRIWRRFLLAQDARFYDLHAAIQACGWLECHLRTFATPKSRQPIAGVPDNFGFDDEPQTRTRRR